MTNTCFLPKNHFGGISEHLEGISKKHADEKN